MAQNFLRGGSDQHLTSDKVSDLQRGSTSTFLPVLLEQLVVCEVYLLG